eukprot:gene25420-11082_t
MWKCRAILPTRFRLGVGKCDRGDIEHLRYSQWGPRLKGTLAGQGAAKCATLNSASITALKLTRFPNPQSSIHALSARICSLNLSLTMTQVTSTQLAHSASNATSMNAGAKLDAGSKLPSGTWTSAMPTIGLLLGMLMLAFFSIFNISTVLTVMINLCGFVSLVCSLISPDPSDESGSCCGSKGNDLTKGGRTTLDTRPAWKLAYNAETASSRCTSHSDGRTAAGAPPALATSHGSTNINRRTSSTSHSGGCTSLNTWASWKLSCDAETTSRRTSRCGGRTAAGAPPPAAASSNSGSSTKPPSLIKEPVWKN